MRDTIADGGKLANLAELINLHGRESDEVKSFVLECDGDEHLASLCRAAIRLNENIERSKQGEYLLMNRSAGCVGNSPQFWKAGGSGYTQWIDEAERFNPDDAKSTVKACQGTHDLVAIHSNILNRLAKRTVDIQDLDFELSELV